MTLEILRAMLGWCAVINLGILIWWVLFLTFAPEWVYRYHSRFIPIDRAHFNTCHYGGMMWFKLGIFFFNIVPYLALRIVGP